jgi:hypothetical protein
MANAGWYRDPRMANTQRFFDGEQWTDQTAPLPPQLVGGSVAGIVVAVTIGILFAVAVLWLVVMFIDDFNL